MRTRDLHRFGILKAKDFNRFSDLHSSLSFKCSIQSQGRQNFCIWRVPKMYQRTVWMRGQLLRSLKSSGKKTVQLSEKLKGMWIFGSICWTTMETKTLKWWKFQDLGQLGESSSRCRHGIFFGAKSLTTKKTEGQQNHMAVFSSFCLAKQLNRDRFTASKFSDMTISSFLNRCVSGFLASTVPIRAAVTKNCGWEAARNWREVVCIRGTSNCRDFSLLDEFPVKRSLS